MTWQQSTRLLELSERVTGDELDIYQFLRETGISNHPTPNEPVASKIQ